MLGFPTVRELGNPGWRKNGHFQRANTLAWFSLFLWFVLLIVLLFVLFVFEFLLFYGNPKIFLENFPIFFKNCVQHFPGITFFNCFMLFITFNKINLKIVFFNESFNFWNKTKNIEKLPIIQWIVFFHFSSK